MALAVAIADRVESRRPRQFLSTSGPCRGEYRSSQIPKADELQLMAAPESDTRQVFKWRVLALIVLTKSDVLAARRVSKRWFGRKYDNVLVQIYVLL